MNAETDLRHLIALARRAVAASWHGTSSEYAAAMKVHQAHYDHVCLRCETDADYRVAYAAASARLLPATSAP